MNLQAILTTLDKINEFGDNFSPIYSGIFHRYMSRTPNALVILKIEETTIGIWRSDPDDEESSMENFNWSLIPVSDPPVTNYVEGSFLSIVKSISSTIGLDI